MTLFGPDGSFWQDGINLTEDDWGAIDFVIWRVVTEGGSLDMTWHWAKEQAEARGKPFAAYSFLSADPRNLDEAVANTIIDTSIPVMADWEKTGCTCDEMLTWVYDLRAKGYTVPLLYTGQAFWAASGSPTLAGNDFDLVVSRYGDQKPAQAYEMIPRYNEMNAKYGRTTWPGFGGLEATLWQFGSRVRWGDRYMDMNAFRGSHSELQQWFTTWAPAPSPPPTPTPPTPPPEEDEVTDDDIERIAKRAAQLVWEYPLADFVTRQTDPNGSQWSGGLLSGAHYEAWAAHHQAT